MHIGLNLGRHFMLYPSFLQLDFHISYEFSWAMLTMAISGKTSFFFV